MLIEAWVNGHFIENADGEFSGSVSSVFPKLKLISRL